ncbi:MAG: ribonuclease PH, partial [Thermodesulfovibrionales bacterium]|nr:ribonuclease PH [Thermodesulfovibrionales bacterium]
MRIDNRANTDLRKLKITRGFVGTADGSVLIEMGNTRVICTASIEEKVPQFLKDQKKGWVNAEYSMLPKSSHTRIVRESSTGRIGGRTHEIQRLIGRALRSVVDLGMLGERTVWIDCDVIEADGSTRTVSITGAFICLADALRNALKTGILE